MDTILENAHLRVTISSQGAELQSIWDRDAQAEWLWHGDSAWWTGRAPLLFPVVGQSPDGLVRINDQLYPMGSHGFARHSEFDLLVSGSDYLVFELTPNAASKACYPFAFRLQVTYKLIEKALSVRAVVFNDDDQEMPFQFGYHPAFVWPLPSAQELEHKIVLVNEAEPGMIRLASDGLLAEELLESRFCAGTLTLSHQDFAAGAMVFPQGAGNHIEYRAGESVITMKTKNLPNFALWQKQGAGYICLEPWHGMAPFASQGDALEARNFAQVLPPNTSQSFEMVLGFQV